MEYREIAPGELDRALFRHFERRQEVTKCRRRENGVWVVRDAPFIDDWSEADYAFLVQCLQNTLATGGVVLGAFADGALKGFASSRSICRAYRTFWMISADTSRIRPPVRVPASISIRTKFSRQITTSRNRRARPFSRRSWIRSLENIQ